MSKLLIPDYLGGQVVAGNCSLTAEVETARIKLHWAFQACFIGLP